MIKHNFITAVILLLTLTGLTSCEEMVTNVDVPDYESKLVVQSFISPEEAFINVYVSESLPLFNNGSDDEIIAITDANILIRGNGYNFIVPWVSDDVGYRLPLSPGSLEGGGNYEIQVSSADGRTVSGECTIPYAFNNTLEISDISTEFNGYDSLYVIRFRFRDTPGKGDYYRVGGMLTAAMDSTSAPYLERLYIDDGEIYVSDINRDGEEFSFTTRVYATGLRKISLFLLTTDKAYYTYHKSVEYNSWGDDPFSEPSLVYSNINNGLGIFCGFRMYTLEKTF